MASPYELGGNTRPEWVNKIKQIGTEVASVHAASVDAEGRFPKETIGALSENGLMGMTVPPEFGGGGGSCRDFVTVVEELATACASSAMIYVMHVSATQAIAASTSLATKSELLKKISAGKHLTTLAFSERGSRSQFWMPTSQLKESQAGWTTSASKSWVTSASHADSYISSAKVVGAKSPMESALFLVDAKSPGVRIESSFDGMGLRGNESAPVTFANVAVDKGSFITEPGKGLEGMLQVVLPWFALGTSAMAHGLCRGAIAATVGHVTTTGFESGPKLRDLPNLRTRIAQMNMQTERSRALLGWTLNEMEKPSEMTPLYVLQSRLSALQTALEVTDSAMKTCGGAAFSKHLPVERFFRDARAGWVMAPTVDHLEDFVGKALTGLPLF